MTLFLSLGKKLILHVHVSPTVTLNVFISCLQATPRQAICHPETTKTTNCKYL